MTFNFSELHFIKHYKNKSFTSIFFIKYSLLIYKLKGINVRLNRSNILKYIFYFILMHISSFFVN